MKKLGTILATATLALTGCTTGNDAPSRSNEIAELNFPTVEDLNTHTAEKYDGSADLHDGNLTITIETRGTELQDKDATLKVLEEIGNAATFDYNTVTITAPGTFGCRYDADQTDDAANGNITVTNIWDHAETCTGTNN